MVGKRITIGQYIPGDSIIHGLDPRTKLLFTFLYILSIFFIKDLWMYGVLALLLVVIVRASGISVLRLVKSLRPMLWILILTALLNLFMTPGEEIFRFGFLKITEEGIEKSIFLALRLTFLIMGSSILTLVTSPKELTDGLDFVLSPLQRFGVPTEQLTMMMTIALRYIPTLFDETDKIMKAQMSRGADFETGNIIQKAKNMVPLLVPLFINSFRRAYELATAMEARCYQVDKPRTRLKELKYETVDWIISFFLLVFFGSIITWWAITR